MELGLKGRTAFITGGSMGIGKAAAAGLAAEGVNLALLARGQEGLDAAAEEISKEHGVEVLAVSADLINSDSVNAAVKAAADKFGDIHILVNNAGHRMRRMDRQLEWDDEDWKGDIDIKTLGMLRVTRAIDPHLPTDGTGRVINVSGVAGTMVFHGALTHGINNSVMIHASRYIAKDLAEKMVTVNVVAPGLVETEWRRGWAKMMAEKNDKSPEEFVTGYAKGLGIFVGTWTPMEEIANAIVFLASDRASYITGATLMVDGGMNVNPR